MKRQNIYSLLFLCFLCTISACRPVTQGHPCSAKIYGYSRNNDCNTYATATFGVFNGTSFTALGNLPAACVTNFGAYNSIDSCYYTFTSDSILSPSRLYRISNSGVVTTFPPDPSAYVHTYCGPVFSPVSGKLYTLKCNRTSGATLSTTINEVLPGIGEVVLDTTMHRLGSNYLGSITINRSTGILYFAINHGRNPLDNLIWHIESYNPATGVHANIDSGSGKFLVGLQYSNTDGRLYALLATSDLDSCSFVTCPIGGTVSILSSLSLGISIEQWSAAIDPCTNNYLFSRGYETLTTISPSGVILRTDNTPGLMYHAMSVAY